MFIQKRVTNWRGYDEETEELSEDLENISGDIADLTKVNGKGGISIFSDEAKTQYKSTYQIIKEISEIYDDLTDKQQAELLEKLAGKRGGQVIGSLIGNFDAAEKALQEMENAAGAADAEMEVIQDSIDYKLNALKQTWVGVAQEMLQRGSLGDVVDSFADASDGFGESLEGLAPVIDTTLLLLESLATILSTITNTLGDATIPVVGFGAAILSNLGSGKILHLKINMPRLECIWCR